MSQPTEASPPPRNLDAETLGYVRRHLLLGWWSLLVFLSLGIGLEALHGFKVGWYLNVSNETRRLMFTLAHAHGTLLALIHLGFAATVRAVPQWSAKSRALASSCLGGAGVLVPAGFFLGGLFIYAGDPGLGILLVPVGALLLFIAVWLTALGVKRSGVAGATTGDTRKKAKG